MAAPDDVGGDGPAATEKLVWSDRKAHALVRQFRLTVVDGPDSGRECVSKKPRAAIGTHESNDLVLQDKWVSRFHCEIVWDGERPRVRDLGSRNATVVDGVSVIEAHLGESAVLTLGATHVQFKVGNEHAKVELSERQQFGAMVGSSVPMRALFAELERAAQSDATVLLEGETGTGKEVAAEGLHMESPRAEGPFIIVDCGAIPADLLESELFGHEKGAFTGAVATRPGAFESADGGTIFLDEIGELSLDLQPKLLRVLERREAKRVGAVKYQPVNVRVVAATNRDLRSEVNAKRFRSDLYYRLAVLEVRLPPLRERKEDLPTLVENMLRRLVAHDAPHAASLRTPDFFAHLMRHSWPGNVRELRNHVERCLALRQRAPIQQSPVGDGGRAGGGGGGIEIDTRQPLKESREAFERRYLEQIVKEHDGNISAAARDAGVDRVAFYRMLWRHGLR